MRAKELLKETSIFTRSTYTFGHMVKVSGSEKGRILSNKIQDIIPDFDPSEKLEWVESSPKNAPRVLLSKSENQRYFKRPNGETFIVIGADTSIQNALNHADRYNRGDIAEGILGAAIAAKLIKRGSDRIGDITVDNIKDVLGHALGTSANSLKYSVNDKNSKIADIINFSIRLPSGSLAAIKNQELWKQFQDLFNSAIHYANSVDAERYSNHFYQNGKVDEIIIQSDGVSDQKERKTDISVVVRDPATGKEHSLRNVDISLKADSIKYGQSTSGGLTQGPDKWLVNAKKVFEPFGINIDMPSQNNDILDFFMDVYQQAATKLDNALSGQDSNKEANFVEKIADVIQSHGVGKNKNIRLVSFSKGTSSIHSFNVLKQRLIKQNIDLGAKLKIGDRSSKPSIFIYDKNSNEILTVIRFYLTDTASTNYFEKGPLLHKLTLITKNSEITKPSADPTQTPKAKSGEPIGQPSSQTPIIPPATPAT
jgi:hypothetical protein